MDPCPAPEALKEKYIGNEIELQLKLNTYKTSKTINGGEKTKLSGFLKDFYNLLQSKSWIVSIFIPFSFYIYIYACIYHICMYRVPDVIEVGGQEYLVSRFVMHGIMAM